MRQARIYRSQHGTAETTSHAVAIMKRMRKLLVPGIIAAVSSCGGSNAVTAPPNALQAVSGSYALIQENGHTMPRVYNQADLNSLVTLGGTLVLRDDNTFTQRTVIGTVYSAGFIQNLPPGAPAPLPQFSRGLDFGTYTVSGSSITFSDGGPGPTGNGVVGVSPDLYPPYGPVKTLTITWPATVNSPGVAYTFQKD